VANHVTAGPARPHRFVQCSNVLVSRPPRVSRRRNGRRIRIKSRSVVNADIESRSLVNYDIESRSVVNRS